VALKDITLVDGDWEEVVSMLATLPNLKSLEIKNAKTLLADPGLDDRLRGWRWTFDPFQPICNWRDLLPVNSSTLVREVWNKRRSVETCKEAGDTGEHMDQDVWAEL
jgi:hypothetical protein